MLELEILKKPLLAISCDTPELSKWSRDAYVNAEICVYPAFLDEGQACGFAEHDCPWECLDRFYYALKSVGSISSDYTSDERPVGFYDLAYRPSHEVKAEKAKKMYKTLSRIEREMEKLAQKFGHPDSFAGHATHFGNAIGAKQVWVWEADSTGYLIPIGSLADYINKQARRLSIECRLLVGKYEGSVRGWTNAPEDHDGFGTKTLQTLNGDYREVEIEGKNYLWQIGRYKSEMKTFLSDEAFWRQIA